MTTRTIPARTVPDTNRLSDEDRRRITAAIRDTIRAGNLNAWTRELDTLERIGAHAIGCATYSLRDSELVEIRATAETLLDLEASRAARTERRANLRRDPDYYTEPGSRDPFLQDVEPTH